jgi:hypothetical protein
MHSRLIDAVERIEGLRYFLVALGLDRFLHERLPLGHGEAHRVGEYGEGIDEGIRTLIIGETARRHAALLFEGKTGMPWAGGGTAWASVASLAERAQVCPIIPCCC